MPVPVRGLGDMGDNGGLFKGIRGTGTARSEPGDERLVLMTGHDGNLSVLGPAGNMLRFLSSVPVLVVRLTS